MLIAEKIIDFVPDRNRKIVVRVFRPEEVEKAWRCRYEIDWPDQMTKRDGYGIDSAQALVIAIYMIGTDLYSSNYHRDGLLAVEGKNSGYGFPIPKIIRDDVPGYDDI